MLGTTLGPYRIESELGTGGMGTVYLAVARERCAVPEGTSVALKVVHPHLLSAPGFFKRFLREAEIGKAVVHPNVVRCFDADAIAVEGVQQNFLVMEYVEGQTLRALLDELEIVPEELCRHIGREVSKGLAAIHEAGVVHRDLKPENVLITPDHEVKVMDLGVARIADEAIRLSRTGAFVGSVLYASPEHFRRAGEGLDGRADMFSLGVVLYELACGAHPHPGDDFASVLASVLDQEPRLLGERNPRLSVFFEQVVHALLAKDRAKRIASGADLLRVLEQGERSTWWGRRARSLRVETRRPLRRIRIPRETAVCGRENDLGRLRALYERARSGDGQVVLIEGEAGIGKTRLVDELIGRLRQDGEDLNFLFGSYPPGGAATAAGAWSTAYREHFGAEGLEETLADYLTVTPILIPAFAALLRGEPTPEGMEPLTKDSLQTVFVHATRALAEERPTVVLIEDLHFAPEEGRAMLAALALAVPEHRILLVGTARPGVSEGWRANLQRLEQASWIALSRLGGKDVANLLVDAFSSERLADELGFQIIRKSDGNPFFVFEIIRGLREGNFITKRPDGTWVSTQVIEEILIPSSVQELIQARIADIDEEEQEILDVAACCGFEFDPRLVADVAGLPLIPALRRLGRLERSHRLVLSAGDRFAFDHHQVQEALYDRISGPLRAEYHAAIGEALLVRHPEPNGATAVDLCEHFFEGERAEKALPHLDAALDHLEKGYMNDQAIALADRALVADDLLAGLPRAEVLLSKAKRLDLLGRREQQESTLEEVTALAEESGDPGLRSRTHRAVGVLRMRQSRYEEARKEFRLARDLARETGDRRTEGLATGNLGATLLNVGRYEEARDLHQRRLAIAREVGDREGEGVARGNLGLVSLILGRLEEAREQFEQSRDVAHEIGHREGEGRATGNLGLVFSSLGRFGEAREHFERSRAIAREIGDRRSEGLATGNLGRLFSSMGRLGEARESIERCLATAREIEDREAETGSLYNLGCILTVLGDLDAADAAHSASLALSRETGAKRWEACALSGLGGVAEQREDPEVGHRFIEESLALRREMGQREAVAECLLQLGSARALTGDADGAREALRKAAGLAEDLGLAVPAVLASARLATQGGDAASALATWAENEPRLGHVDRMEARCLLWRATRDPSHLEEAHRLLCHLRDHAPEEYRATMVANVRLHRDIARDWSAQDGVA